MTAKFRLQFCFSLLLGLFPVLATAATIEFRTLIDVDNSAATGCTVGGMTGVEHVLVTLVKTDATSGAVDKSYRLVCSGNSFGDPIDVDTTGWPVGFNASTGGMLVENRIAFSVLGSGMPSGIRLGFDASTGSSVHGVSAGSTGASIIYPDMPGRRRSVASPGNTERFFQLDGEGQDWGNINPVANSIAGGGSPAIRMIKVFAFANPTDEYIYFRVDATAGSAAPFAEDDEYSRLPGQNLAVAAPGVLTNDGDPNGQPITALPVTPATHGDVTLNADGSFTYNPSNPASTQTDSFQYKATNGAQESNVAKVTINVSAVANNAPTALNDTGTTDEDQPLNVGAPGVLGNDSDPDGDSLSASKTTDPANGTAVVNADGSFTYTPDLDFVGTDSFTYTITDGEFTSTATVTITIESVNDAPAVTPDSFAVDENSPNGTAVGTVVVTDVDAGDTHTFAITGGNTGNAFAINNSGQITVADGTVLDFELNPTFSLTVTATDNGVPALSGSATITVTLNDVNEAPVALDDSTTVAEDGNVNIAAPGLIANDNDQDGDTMSATKLTDPANGVATVAANGGWTYAPNANFFGTDSFTYQVTDGEFNSTATVTITVTPVNDPPSFTAGPNVTVAEDTAFSAAWATGISAGPPNESGQTLTFNVSNNNNALFSVQPAVSPSGVLSFTPAANMNGSATVTVSVTDNGGGTDTSPTQNFTITVNPANDPPSFTKGPDQTVNEDSGLNTVGGWATAISAGPADEAGQTLTFNVSNDNNGLFTGGGQPAVAANGTLTFTTAANQYGSANVTISLTDNGGGTDTSPTQTFVITITPVNDMGSFTKGADQTVLEDSGTTTVNGWATAINPGPNESDLVVFNVSNDNNALFTGGGQPAVAPNGTLTYTLAPNANGTTTVTVTMTDDGMTPGSPGDDLTTAGQTFTITVTAVNDTPSFTSGGNVNVLEDSSAYSAAWATAISAGPADEAGQTLTFNVTGNTNPGLFSVAPQIAANGTLSFTLNANVFGTSTITVNLSDNGGILNGGDDASDPVSFDIIVTNVNDEPTFTTGGNVTVLEDSGAYSAAWATGISAGPNEGSQTVTFNITGNTLPGLFASGPSIAADGTLSFTLNLNANGTSTISVNLTDNGGTANSGDDTSATVNFDIIVTPVNDEPSFTSGGNVTVLEDSGAYSAGWATGISAGPADEAGQTLTFNITGNTTPGLFSVAPQIAANGTLSFTLNANVFGTSTITVNLSDNGGILNGGDDTSSDVSFDIIVTNVNDEPSFTTGGNVTVLEDSSAYSAAWATGISAGPNEGGQTLTFNITGNTLPGLFATGPSIAADGTLSFTLNLNANGTSTISVNLTDNGGTANSGDDTSATVNFDIIVTPVNDEPTFTSGGNVTVLEDSGAYSAGWATGISAGPADEAGQTLTFNITGNTTPGLFSVAPQIAANGTLSFTLNPNVFGTSTITVNLSDNGGILNGGDDTSGDVNFDIIVTNVNDEPSFTSGGNVTVLEDSSAYSAAWATGISAGPNEGSQTLTFNITGNTLPGLFATGPSIAADGTLSFTLNLNANGTSTISVNLSDNGGTANSGDDTSATVNFDIIVTPVNDEPSFTSGGNVTVLEDSGAYSAAWATAISAGPADESGQTLTFNITGNTTPGLFSVAPQIAANGTLSFTLNPNVFGTSTITVNLSDNGGILNGGDDTSGNVNFDIIVTNVNDEPSFTSGGNVTVLEDSSAYSAAWATGISAGPNEGGQVLTFNITGNTTPGLFATGPSIAANGTLSFTLNANANGTSTITVNLSDDGGVLNGGDDTSPSVNFDIIVTAVNDEPSFTSGGNVNVLEDSGAYSAGWATGISAGPADESGQTLTFNITGNTTPGLFSVAPQIAANGTLSFTLNPNVFGTSTITVNLSDNGGILNGGDDTSGNVNFGIIVANVNDEPSFTSGGNVTVLEDSSAYSAAWASGISAGPNEGGQTLTFNITGNTTPGLFLSGPSIASNGTLSFTLNPNANGTSTITVNLSDNGGVLNGGDDTSPSVNFDIIVTPVNDEPFFTVQEPAFIVLGTTGPQTSTVATGISAGAANESGQTLTFTVTGNTNPGIFSAGPTVASDGTLSWTPTPAVHGTSLITITLSDNGGILNGGDDTSAGQSFTVAIERGPTVDSTSPVEGAPTVNTTDNIIINFSEAVSYDSGAFTINCGGNVPFTTAAGPAASYTLDPTGTMTAGPCTVTVDDVKIHDVDTYDPPDNLPGDFVLNFTVNTPPTANDDANSALGNVTLTVAAAQGVLANDTDPDAGSSLTVDLTFGTGNPYTTSAGGTVTFGTDGSYTYLSQAGDQNIATDTVTYRVKDNNNATDTGVLTINLGPRVIYVDDVGVAGDGRDTSPFQSISLAEAGAGQTQAVAGDIILVKSGNYTDAVTLKNTQTVLGQGISANHTITHNSVVFTVLLAGSAPTYATAAGNAFTLAASNTIRGLAINPAAGRGIIGNAFTAVTVNETSISAAGGAALDLTTGAATVTLTSTSSSGSGTNGVNLNAVTGSVALGTGAITTPTSAAFNVSGGTATITYAGNISSGSNTAVTIASHTTNNITLSGTITGTTGGISVTNKTSGTVSFSGAQNLNTGGNPGVSLNTNNGSTIAFSGAGLAITTSTGAAFSASGGGTLSVTGTTNTISVTGAGSGLTLNGMTIASGNNVTFNSIAAVATTTTGVQLTALLGTGSVVVNGGTNSAATGVALNNMGTVGTTLSGCTINGAVGITGVAGFGTLTVTGVTLNNANQALNLTNGTINTGSTFTSVSCTGTGNATPVFLSGVGGSFTVSAGAVADSAATNTVFNVVGGTATIVWNGTLTQTSNAAPLVDVSGTHTGNITFGGNLTANQGTGLVFADADGVYAINGATNNLTVTARISISGGSAGTFTFSAGTSVNSGAANIPFSFDSSTAGVTYSGNITQTGAARAVSIVNQTSGTITFQTNTIACNTSCTGILMSNADGTVNFNGTNTLNGANSGVDIDTTSIGTFTFASTSAITTTADIGFRVNGSAPAGLTYPGTITANSSRAVEISNAAAAACVTGGGNNLTFSGNITSSGASATGIIVDRCSSGTINFSGGTKTLNTAGNTAVTIVTNGATVNFTNGGLDIDTTSGTGITASGGGTLTVQTGGNPNSILTTTGTALTMNATQIGALGLTFQSINVDGTDAAPTNAISLTSTGSTGGLTVTGTGGTCTFATPTCTGGTIRDTSGDGIFLSSSGKHSFSNMQITSNLGSGIKGATVNGLAIDNSVFSANGDNAATDDSGIDIDELTGNLRGGTHPTKITNSQFNENWEFELQIANTTGTLQDFYMTGNTFTAAGAGGVVGNLVNFLGSASANMTIDVQGVNFTGSAPNTATGLHMDSSGGSMNVNVNGGTYTNNNVAINVSTANSGVLDFLVNGVTATGNRSSGLNLFLNANSTGSVDGTFSNNIVGTDGVAGSGSQLGSPMTLSNETTTTACPMTVAITGNTLQESTSFSSLSIFHGINSGSTSSTFTTITGNTFRNSGARGLEFLPGNSGTSGTICADVQGNTFSGTILGQAGNGSRIRLAQLGTGTINVRQTSTADIAAVNTGVTAAQVSTLNVTFNGGACPLP